MKNNKGISLIVLVITIIVMIILAGVIILSLSNSGIITKAEDAVDKTNLSEVQHLATLIWSEEYLKQQEAGNINEDELYNAVETGLIKEKIDVTKYYLIVTSTGVSVESSNGTTITSAPEEWKANVTKLVDGVPIPKGFVASMATGENKENTGLVIYEGTGIVTDKNVDKAKFTRNQFVWVPVEKNNFDSQFVRKDFGMGYPLSQTGIDDFWEVLPTTEATTEFLKWHTTETIEEVQKMYASIKEYGGFYIARYEAGIDTQITELGEVAERIGIKEGTKVYFTMGKIPYNQMTAEDISTKEKGGAIEIARKLYPESSTATGVVSTLAYGVQWDRTLQWFVDRGAMSIDELNNTAGSTSYGNYLDHKLKVGDLNSGAKYAVLDEDPELWPERLGTFKDVEYDENGKSITINVEALTTGALKSAKINNIYDMAGNMAELTMENAISYHDSYHVLRGGCFDSSGAGTVGDPISSRYSWGYDGITISAIEELDVMGFRPTLYIKK